MFTVLVCGSREWVDPSLYAWICWLPRDARIIHGACDRGADAMADTFASAYGHRVDRFPADWSRGKRAGPERNQEMINIGRPDWVLAFSRLDSLGTPTRGTADLVRRALRVPIPVALIEPGVFPPLAKWLGVK